MEINELRTLLIEKEEQNNRLRQQLSELTIRYDVLKTFANGESYMGDTKDQSAVVAQAMNMGKTFK